MKIQFYDKNTLKVIFDSEHEYASYFVMNDKVYKDNGYTCESQCSVVGFETFIEEMPNIGWRIAND